MKLTGQPISKAAALEGCGRTGAGGEGRVEVAQAPPILTVCETSLSNLCIKAKVYGIIVL